MINVFLVRHGEAAATWSQAADPGLSPRGHAQAAAVAAALVSRPVSALCASPLLRAQETAAPLARAWAAPVTIDERFRELPSTLPLAERAAWLRGIMQSRWADVGLPLASWRTAAWRALRALDSDTVIFTHFMVINALVGLATGDERLVVFNPDHGSITQFSVSAQEVTLIAHGQEKATTVL